MRPSGLGLRLKSRQLQPAGCGGARKLPLGTTGLPFDGDDALPSEGVACGGDRAVMRGILPSMGDRLLVRDRRVPGGGESSWSSPSMPPLSRICDDCGVVRRLPERVVGAEYSAASEDEGSTTRGGSAAAAALLRRCDMVLMLFLAAAVRESGGSEAQAAVPAKMRRGSKRSESTTKSGEEEGECLSRRARRREESSA